MKNKKTKRVFIILILLILLGLILFFQKTIPQKIGKVFSSLDNQSSASLNKQKLSAEEIGKPLNQTSIYKELCQQEVKWPTKESITSKVFPASNFQTQLISENIFYKKNNAPTRIVRNVGSEIILFQEDAEGFPSPVSFVDDSQINKFIAGYSKAIIQRLVEYTTTKTSLLLSYEDDEITEIKIDSGKTFIECEDNQCRCDTL